MGKPCSVCAHSQRGEIDRRLAWQVVNLSQLATAFGLKRDALRRHRERHLPGFLPAFAAEAAGLSVDTLNAEAQRLYHVTLDALAQAEQGVLTNIEKNAAGDVVESRRVSSSAVARLIREARAGLDLLTKLAASGEVAPAVQEHGRDAALEARLLAALDRVTQRSLPAVVDAEVVGEAPDTPGPSPGATPATFARGEAPFSQPDHPENLPANRPNSVEQPPTAPAEEESAEAIATEDAPDPTGMSSTSWRTPRWTGNPAASLEERAADYTSSIPIRGPNAGEPGSHRRESR